MISTATIPQLYSFSQSPVVVQLGTNLVGSPNLSILLKVEVEVNGAWVANAPLVCVPNNNGVATFRLEKMLHAYTSLFFPSGSGVQTKPLLKYRLNYTESYGAPPTANAYIQSSVFYLVRGGLRTEEFNNLNLQKSFLGISPAKFLSTCPAFKRVKPESLEYLYLLGVPSAAYLRLNAKVVLKNGTENEYLNIAQASITAPCIVRFEAGYNRLTALTDNADDVLYYVLFITDSSGKRSMDTRTYTFDHNGRQHKQLVYENSMGGFDTLTLTGNFKEGTNHAKQTVSKYIDWDWLIARNGEYQRGGTQSYLNSYKFGVQANTGYKTVEEIRALSDLLHSQNTWEWNGKKMLAVNIESNSLEIRERDRHTYEAVISYTHANEYGSVLPDLDATPSLEYNPETTPTGVGDFDSLDFDSLDFDTA